MGQFDSICHGAEERGGEYPPLTLVAPSMVTRESEASRSTPALRNPAALGYRPRPSLVWALVAYDASGIPPLSSR
ncbi:MAG: hypothetical protein V3S33_07960 [Gammaproteobacteria bacterium]